MREPPEGTIARDDEGSAAAPARSGRLGTAWLEEIPLELTMDLMERGRERFAVYCAPCHGFDGNANTPVAAAMELTPPPSLHSDRAREHPPGMLYAVVQRGFGLMPGYGYQLPVRDRWAVVAYVRALQLSAGVSLDSLPAEVRSEIEERLPPGPDAAEAAR